MHFLTHRVIFEVTDNPEFLYAKSDVVTFEVRDYCWIWAYYSPTGVYKASDLKESNVKYDDGSKAFLGTINSTKQIYLFYCNLSKIENDANGWRLEHHTSTVVCFNQSKWIRSDKKQAMVMLFSHEFFSYRNALKCCILKN